MHGKSGIINLKYESNKFVNEQSCNAKVEIVLENCMNYYPVFGLNLISIQDSSNTYDLEIVVTYRYHN